MVVATLGTYWIAIVSATKKATNVAVYIGTVTMNFSLQGEGKLVRKPNPSIQKPTV